LHVFPWRPAMRSAGLTQHALYLVRPDGHVALVDLGTISSPLLRYMENIRGERRRGGVS